MIIESTYKSPRVTIDNGILNITGVSVPPNSVDFYHPILEFVRHTESIIINFKLKYFNVSSSCQFIKILKEIESKKSQVNWIYDNEDMLEAGKDLMYLAKIPFNFLPY